jgi:hypothetical protein
MSTWVWLVIIVAILFIWWLWSRFGSTYSFLANNPDVVNAGQAVGRYYTDIAGLVNAFQAASDNQGNFTSRLGTFFGTLPK